MPHLVVSRLGELPSLVEVSKRSTTYEIERLERMGFLAVTVEEWEANGGNFFPPPSTSDRLAHVLTESGDDGK